MQATVGDILQLDVARGFQVEAGAAGLGRLVSDIEILDYEFSPGVTVERDVLMSPHGLVLSSLLFAQSDPALVTGAIERLVELGCSGLLYKRIVLDHLPQEALNLAEKQSFPVVSFGDDVTFERLIFDVQTFLGDCAGHERVSEVFRRLVEEPPVGDKDDLAAATALFREPGRYVKVYAIQYRRAPEDYQRTQLRRVADRGGDVRLAVGIYRGQLLAAVTGNQDRESAFDEQVRRMLADLPADVDTPCTGESELHETTELARAVAEARQAAVVGEIEGQVRTRYPLIGTYKVILDPRAREAVFDFAADYLKPLLAQQGEDAQVLLQTAVAYMQARGNVEEASHRLSCHQNTVRYRVGKLRGLLKQYSVDEEINYEELDLAVKAYLYRQYLQRA